MASNDYESLCERLTNEAEKLEAEQKKDIDVVLEKKFFAALNAKTVGELYELDFTLDELETIIKDSELYLRKAEHCSELERYFSNNIVSLNSQRKTHVIL